MKAKYLMEVANTYCMVSSFLQLTYHHDNPDAMVALQVDDKDSFYRMYVYLAP
jgi:hypothetical protein